MESTYASSGTYRGLIHKKLDWKMRDLIYGIEGRVTESSYSTVVGNLWVCENDACRNRWRAITRNRERQNSV